MLNDVKAMVIIVQGVAIEHHTTIRSTTTAITARNTLRYFYNRLTMQNQVSVSRRHHEVKMEIGVTMAKNPDSFDELVVGLQTF